MQRDNSLKHGIPFGWHVPSQRMANVNDVRNGQACECVCVACGVRLQARQGAIRAWHFAHDEETDCLGVAEAAIHRMAKQMIAERGCVFMPSKQLSRTIYGERQVWSETITVEVQVAGVHRLADCEQEKTLRDSQSEGSSRRPDVFALLDGTPLIIEILNTHAVDLEKLEWLERQGCSALEIDVADLEHLTPDEILEALEVRLFQTSAHSVWLVHAGDEEAKRSLDQLEAQIRVMRREEEATLLAKLDKETEARKRREEALKHFRDIEDFKISLDGYTVRIGRNEQRVSLKIHGYAPREVFDATKQLGCKHKGHFNGRARCCEFHRYSENKAFFKQLRDEVQKGCFACHTQSMLLTSVQQQAPSLRAERQVEQPLPIYFDDQDRQEAFDERAAILEFEAGFSRDEAEKRALAEITALLGHRDG